MRRPTLLAAFTFLALTGATCPAVSGASEAPEAPSSVAQGPALVREGRRLVDAPGLLRIRGEEWAFETVTDGRRRAFSLMPSLKLGELEQVAAARGEGEYRVSGRVYVYQKRNYLLISGFSSIGDAEELATQESATGAPSVADLIREFESDRAERKKAPGAAGGRKGEAVPVRREGTTITLARGRIIQNPSGWAYFEPFPPEGALEKDAAASTPVMLLPSLMLEELESLAAFSNQAPVVTLSGEFFAHQGRNYLLPRMYLVERTPTEHDDELPPIAGEVAK